MAKEKEQLSLIEADPVWKDAWEGMPGYEHQDQTAYRSIIVHFRTPADAEKFTKLIGQKLHKKQKFLWFPEAEIGHFADKSFVAENPVNPKYPVYIISKGRWEARPTSKALEKIHVPYRIVVEPQEFDNYAAVIDPKKILVLPFSNLGQGSIPARNWVWEHSISEGAERHWILDDNIEGFFRYENNLKTPVGDGTIFSIAENFVNRYENVSLAGFNYFMFVSRKSGDIPPYYPNTRVYSCILIENKTKFRWRGRYNEDTDLSLRVLKNGDCTILFNAFLAFKMTTMTMKGGNTDELYQDDGRLKMAESLVEQHPDCVVVSEKWGRAQHHVNYKLFSNNKLKLKEDAITESEPLFILEQRAPVEKKKPALEKTKNAISRIKVIHNPPPRVEAVMPWSAPSELPSLAGIKRLAIDCETCDPDLLTLGPGVRRGGYIVGLAIGADDVRRWYLPTRHEGGGNLDQAMVRRWAIEELNKFSGELVGANLLYDLDFLGHESWGVSFPNVTAFHDVQVAEPLIDEWRKEYTLDAISKDYLGIGKDETVLREAAAMQGATTNDQIKKIIWKLPAGYVGQYAEGDVDRPLRILPLQFKKLQDENLEEVYTIERKLIPILLAMRQRGVRVNVDHAEYVREQLALSRDEALKKVRAIAGPRAELMAPESFANSFQEPPPRTPKTDKPSVTKGWLEAHQSDPLAAAISEGRAVDYLINTFIDGHIRTHSINGRIHAQFNQLKGEGGGTIARFSSSNPNLQNIPARDEELAPLIRGLFLPDEGEIFNRLDYSQIEYRLLAHFAVGPGAEEARRKYNDDPKTNFHKFCATMMGMDPESKSVLKKAKGTNFCKVYGGGVPKIALVIGCSLAEAEEFTNIYDRELPFVKSTLEAAMKWAQKQGYVTTVLGRRQRFPLWEPAGYGGNQPPLRHEMAIQCYGHRIQRYMTYAALNRKNQGSSADITKKAMVDCWEAGLQRVLGAPLVTVHDELDLSVPDTQGGEEAVQEYKRLMEETVKLKVPVLVERESGPNWGEVE